MNSAPIGIFDSGIGGLTVAKEIIKTLPNESVIYIGDTARVPYGTRSKEVVTKFALELAKFLLRRKVKCLVVACNTISALSLKEIKKNSPIPVVEVVTPAIRLAVLLSKTGKIGVIGTQGTIASKAYEIEIKKIKHMAKVFSSACPLFVPMAEEGLNHHKVTTLIAREYLADMKKAKIDTLILGCTHYPLLIDAIREAVGDNVILIDSSKPTTEELRKTLKEHKLLSESTNPNYQFFVTDAPERVYQVAERFFGDALNGKLKKINLSE